MPADAGLDWRAVRNQPARATAEKPPGTHSGSGLRRNRSGGSNQGSSPTPRKLCVGVGDAEAVTVAKLKDMFGAFGEVMRVDTPKGKSYSFVEFAERTAAARALAALNNQPLFGRHSVGVSYARSRTGDAPVDPTEAKLWVSGIGPHVRKAEIMDAFQAYGRVTRIDMPLGKDYAFVWFERFADAETAKRSLHNQPIGGHDVRITYSNKATGSAPGRPREPSSARVPRVTPAVTKSEPLSARAPPPSPTVPQLPRSGSRSPHASWSGVVSRAGQGRLATVVAFASTWSLWYDDPAQHAAGPAILGTFSDPTSFLDVVGKRLPRVLRGGSRLLLLRSGLPPTAHACADGGQISMRIRDSSSVWFDLMNTVMLEELSYKDSVSGVVLERTDGAARDDRDSLFMWLDKADGAPTTQAATDELRSALKLGSDFQATHRQSFESPTGGWHTAAGGDPSWSQLRGGTASVTSSSSGGRWSPSSCGSSTSSGSSNASQAVTPLSTPLFIGHGRDAECVEVPTRPPIKLRPSSALRPYGDGPKIEPVRARLVQRSGRGSDGASRLESDEADADRAQEEPAANPPRTRLHSVQEQPEAQPSLLQRVNGKWKGGKVIAAPARKPCGSPRARGARLWMAAPLCSGLVTVMLGLWFYFVYVGAAAAAATT